MEMDYIEKIGQKKTILISISILLVSLHTIYYYNSVMQEVDTKKIIQQIVRFILTIGLLVMIYQGKNWARIISIILFSLGVLGAVFGLLTLSQPIALKIPLIVMTVVYTAAIYHFWLSKSFKAFFRFQNIKNNS